MATNSNACHGLQTYQKRHTSWNVAVTILQPYGRRARITQQPGSEIQNRSRGRKPSFLRPKQNQSFESSIFDAPTAKFLSTVKPRLTFTFKQFKNTNASHRLKRPIKRSQPCGCHISEGVQCQQRFISTSIVV